MNAQARLIRPKRIDATRQRRPAVPPSIDLEPATAYEAITRQKVDALEDDLGEIKSRVDNIFYLVIGSILVDMLSRWVS